MKVLLFVLLTVASFEAIADLSYYPTDVQEKLKSAKSFDVKETLYTVLIMKHVQKRGRNDVLVSDCGQASGGTCYGHRVLGYRGARKVLFGKLHLEDSSNGYYVKDVYCRKQFTKADGVGKNQIPNHQKINCEHTWPQSKFTGQFPKETQKSDLHHLYPTDSRANSVRGNHEFSNGGSNLDNCSPSSSSGSTFEPPNEHKGNAARAIFYFSTRYKIAISPKQEATLRDWNRLDPVDAEERERNEWIQKIQGNRNPFIDYNYLIDRVANF